MQKLAITTLFFAALMTDASANDSYTDYYPETGEFDVSDYRETGFEDDFDRGHSFDEYADDDPEIDRENDDYIDLESSSESPFEYWRDESEVPEWAKPCVYDQLLRVDVTTTVQIDDDPLHNYSNYTTKKIDRQAVQKLKLRALKMLKRVIKKNGRISVALEQKLINLFALEGSFEITTEWAEETLSMMEADAEITTEYWQRNLVISFDQEFSFRKVYEIEMLWGGEACTPQEKNFLEVVVGPWQTVRISDRMVTKTIIFEKHRVDWEKYIEDMIERGVELIGDPDLINHDDDPEEVIDAIEKANEAGAELRLFDDVELESDSYQGDFPHDYEE